MRVCRPYGIRTPFASTQTHSTAATSTPSETSARMVDRNVLPGCFLLLETCREMLPRVLTLDEFHEEPRRDLQHARAPDY